jgi:hypothetical protein
MSASAPVTATAWLAAAAGPVTAAEADAPGSVAEILTAIFLRPARTPAAPAARAAPAAPAARAAPAAPAAPAAAGARPSTDQDASRSSRSSDERHPVTGS